MRQVAADKRAPIHRIVEIAQHGPHHIRPFAGLGSLPLLDEVARLQYAARAEILDISREHFGCAVEIGRGVALPFAPFQ